MIISLGMPVFLLLPPFHGNKASLPTFPYSNCKRDHFSSRKKRKRTAQKEGLHVTAATSPFIPLLALSIHIYPLHAFVQLPVIPVSQKPTFTPTTHILVIPVALQAAFTPGIHPHLGLRRSHHSRAIGSSYIRPTCPNQYSRISLITLHFQFSIAFTEQKRQVPFCMAIGNVELVHGCFPKHLHMGITRLK